LLEVESRLLELKKLGVTAVEFAGNCLAARVPVLGKGYTGVVVIAYVGEQERFALKIRRIDSGVKDFFHESDMLQKANKVEVGPRFVAGSKNFLLSQLVDGDLLVDWLTIHKKPDVFRSVLGDVLEQCWRLDRAGLDHGELSNAYKHLLVDKNGKVFIVDFETASIKRKVLNVTSVCHHLFVKEKAMSRLIWEVLGEKDINQICAVLRNYKKGCYRNSFEALLQKCL
jgi:putative serine/threonine protein kinase